MRRSARKIKTDEPQRAQRSQRKAQRKKFNFFCFSFISVRFSVLSVNSVVQSAFHALRAAQPRDDSVAQMFIYP